MTPFWKRGPRTPLDAARAGYRLAREYRNTGWVSAADAWCAEAVRAGDVAQAADAYWERVIVAPVESARQVPLARRLVPLSTGQDVVAEAGYRQLLAGHVERAVRVLEHGRGVLLRRAVGAITPAQRSALLSRGRRDLLDEYLRAVDEVAGLLRDQHARRTAVIPALSVGGTPYALRGLDPMVAAQERVEAREAEIARVLGAGQGPPAYADIRAVAVDGPLVYVAAATEGYALVVRPGAAPEPISLPALTAGRATGLVADLRDPAAVGEVPQRAVRSAVDWLAAVLGGLRSALRDEPAVTLVPVGVLGLLPLHAVFAQGVRYAPSARALPPHADPVRPGATVLTVSAEDPWTPDGRQPPPAMRLAAAQTARLTRLYGHRLRRLEQARADQVVGGLGTADVCHFICHGEADQHHGLDNRLLLADRHLTLAEILAREPLRQRLVVLGACESGVPDPRLPDETVSFSGALMQAGVEAVVAALWRVDEVAAALVLQRFHEGVAAGWLPVQAMAEAQRWLRSATRGEIKARYPDLYRNRFASDPTVIPYAEPVHWAAFTYYGA
ncbi:CHAT domain-containing protein [Actinoplanes sp. CA-252034]|uniref:CHAT domain-containing protein n=1 Tax=Actinoplanes sp. CA-252034 TaxID=3239906 RepID=UPI003D97612D